MGRRATIGVRAVLAAAAVAALLWLGSGLRAVRDENEAIRLTRSDDPAAIARAETLLLRAAERTPSTRPELRLAQLRVFAGRPEAARPVVEAIVRREPENADAWELLVLVSGPARASAARARLQALRPDVPRAAPPAG